MAKPKALLVGKIDHAQSSWDALSSLADLVTPQSDNRSDFLQECRSGRLDGVVVICDRAPSSFSVTGSKWDAEFIHALPSTVKFICHNGAGYDSIDVEACTSRGILVSNCPKVVDNATADTAIFLILATLREFNNGIMAIRNGTWTSSVPPPPLGRDPNGKVLGILGLGSIGRTLLKKAAVFDMKVVYYNRKRLNAELEEGAEYVGFEELLARSDVLSLNLPLNNHTRNLISTKEFTMMKDGIIIINTARGGVLDEAALVEALETGRVQSVGLDVYQQEPNIHPGLVSNPRVCLLPHMGTSTVETKTQMEEWNIGNVRAVLETGRLNNVVPEQSDLMQ